MRKVQVVIVTVLATMVLSGSASATESISVVTEPGGAACTVSTCTTGMSSSGGIEFRGHLFGFESHANECNVSFTLQITSNGSGDISYPSFGQGDADCSDWVACSTPWSFNTEETSVSTAQMDISVCVDETILGKCQGVISGTVVRTGTNHRYALSVNDASIGGTLTTTCEVTGAWVQAGTINGFEIVHQ